MMLPSTHTSPLPPLCSHLLASARAARRCACLLTWMREAASWVMGVWWVLPPLLAPLPLPPPLDPPPLDPPPTARGAILALHV